MATLNIGGGTSSRGLVAGTDATYQIISVPAAAAASQYR